MPYHQEHEAAQYVIKFIDAFGDEYKENIEFVKHPNVCILYISTFYI